MLPAVLSAERVSIFRVMLKCDVHTNERSSIRGQNLTSNYTHSTAQRKRERERERERESHCKRNQRIRQERSKLREEHSLFSNQRKIQYMLQSILNFLKLDDDCKNHFGRLFYVESLLIAASCYCISIWEPEKQLTRANEMLEHILTICVWTCFWTQHHHIKGIVHPKILCLSAYLHSIWG